MTTPVTQAAAAEQVAKWRFNNEVVAVAKNGTLGGFFIFWGVLE